jgi:GTP-binding protein
VVDTAGFDPVAKEGIVHEMAKQAEQAIAEADALLFMVDARNGLTPTTSRSLRACAGGRPTFLVVNKAEGMNRASCRRSSTPSASATPCASPRPMATTCMR